MNNENILWEGKPSKKFILYYSFLHFDTSLDVSYIKRIGPIGLTVLIILWIFGFFYLLFNIEARESAGWGGLIIVGIILALFAVSLIIYNTFLKKFYLYTITNNSVRISGGVFKKVDKEILFSKITDINISQNIFEKLLGIYDLHIQTAGSRSLAKEKPEMSFLALEDPITPRDLILKRVSKQNVQRRS